MAGGLFKRGLPQIKLEARSLYLIIFDKVGRSLSGWHYSKLQEFRPLWIQKSAVVVDDVRVARRLVKKLREFGVREVRLFKAIDITDST
jgi:hypothetical protein